MIKTLCAEQNRKHSLFKLGPLCKKKSCSAAFLFLFLKLCRDHNNYTRYRQAVNGCKNIFL